MRTDNPVTPSVTKVSDYKPYPFAIGTVRPTFKLFEGDKPSDCVTQITCEIEMSAKPEHAASKPDLELRLHPSIQNGAFSIKRGDEIEKLSANNYTISGDLMTIPYPGDEFVFLADVENKPEENLSLGGLYRQDNIYCTQCEAEDFRRMMPFPDRPDAIAKEFIVRIEGDKKVNPIMLSNGNLIEQGDLDDDRHFAVWHDPFAKPCYLFALVAGELDRIDDTFTTVSGRKVSVPFLSRPEDADQLRFAQEELITSMKWDEDDYGCEYDLDIFHVVAVTAFNMGAMENKSLNIFNPRLVLARPDLTTDAAYIDVSRVIAHEYFHNWSGNRVTCRDWFQLSLKEGFTVFRENSFARFRFDETVERIRDVRKLLAHQFTEDAGAMAHPVQPKEYIEIDNFYTMTVYEKGGEVIGMYKRLMGAEKFRAATDLYFSRHDGDAATIEDFLACMQEASGMDLTQFRRWYDQAGTPTVKAQGRYDADQKQYVLTLSQSTPATPGQPTKQPFHMPVVIGLLDTDGNEQASQLLELKEETQEFVFDGIESAPTPSISRDFSAPVFLNTDDVLTETDLGFLMEKDSDGLVRWDASQKLLVKAIEREIQAECNNSDGPSEDDIVAAFSKTIDALKNNGRGLLAELLTFPSEAYLGLIFTPANPEENHAALKRVKKKISGALMPQLQALYEATTPNNKPFSVDNDVMADRHLRNVVLGMIACADPEAGIALAEAQYNDNLMPDGSKDFTNDKTMTAIMGAMNVASDIDHPARARMMSDYYERFEHDDLVVNMWFTLQASAKGESILDDVKKLTQHPAFNTDNPNRARSVLGAFGANQSAFHRRDGAGYKFIADWIIELDSKNPSMAARLLTPFKGWKNFAPELQPLMQAALQSILDADGERSPGVYEITAKALGIHEG